LASNLITPKSNVPIPTPADGAMFGAIELMKALESCPKGKMKEWYRHWVQMKFIPTISYEQTTKKFKKYMAKKLIQTGS
jgi:hypothetical protein